MIDLGRIIMKENFMAMPRNQLTGVKRLIRKRNTQQYATDDSWTRDPCEAMVFDDILEAAQICSVRQLHDVEITLRLEAHACDFFHTNLD